MIQEIREQFDHYCTLRFTDEELNWLKTNLPWLSVGYINYLKFWHPVREEVSINENNITSYNDCGLAIEARGTWLNTSMYEIPLLAIVNEVYFAFKYGVHAKDDIFKRKTIEKVNRIKRVPILSIEGPPPNMIPSGFMALISSKLVSFETSLFSIPR